MKLTHCSQCSLLIPLKTSENRFSDVFRGIKWDHLEEIGFITFICLERQWGNKQKYPLRKSNIAESAGNVFLFIDIAHVNMWVKYTYQKRCLVTHALIECKQ